MIKLTLISDTHNYHNKLNDKLPGGDILIHAGDVSSMGYMHEIKYFLEWFSKIPGYTYKIFIAGNHDFLFEKNPNMAKMLVNEYSNIIYLENEEISIPVREHYIKIYGSPIQPCYHNWAFNVKRDSDEIESYWNKIPDDTDILITHGPVHNILDLAKFRNVHTGCERLEKVIFKKHPKMHVCGHIHEGYGWLSKMKTHFFNASVMNENYDCENDPFNIEWDPELNKIIFKKNE